MSTPGSQAPSRFAGLSLDDGVARVVVVAPAGAVGSAVTDPAAEGPDPNSSEGRLTVIDAAEVSLPAGVVVDGRVRDNAALGLGLGQLWRELNLGGVPTFLGLQPADAWVQVLTLPSLPDSGIPAEVSGAVDIMRSYYHEDPVWSVAVVGPQDAAVEPAHGASVRLVGCRREDLSAAAWAARRSGIWVTGIKLTATSLAALVRQPRTGGLVLLDDAGAGPAIVVVLGGDAAPGVRAVGRFGEAIGPIVGSVVAAEVDDATLAAWTAALDPALTGERATQAVSALVGRAQFEPLPSAGFAEVLAQDSPRPLDECAAALGLAVAAAGVGLRTDDLQRSLLHGGVGAIQGQLLSTPLPQDAAGGAGHPDNADGGKPLTGSTPAARRTTPSGSRATSLLPPPRIQAGVVRSVGLLHGGSLERSHPKMAAAARPSAMSTGLAMAAVPFGGSLPFLAPAMSNRRAPAWVHRAGLHRGQPHAAVLDGDQLELRGAVSQAIVAQQVRRSAVRLFGTEAVVGELCIHPDADPDAANGVRWDRRFSFAPGAADLVAEHDEILDELADLLEDYPWASLVIEGHSDIEGDLGDNLRLSKARAEAVAEVLVAEGCDVARIAVRGRGPFAPLSDGDTPIIRALHRRVDVTFLGLLA